MKKRTILSVVACIFFMATFNAQSPEGMPIEKVGTLDAIITNLYDVVSGAKTKERDWELLKYLCQDDAKLIAYSEGENSMTYMSVDDYAEKAGDYFSKNDFFEREIHRAVNTFGPITQVFSTYESFDSETAEIPFARGINSIQLLNDGERWWIVNIYWTSESETNPIPKKYLPKS